MTIQLAQNIRTFRKQRALTQEQLAEVLGVTVGAVYKWEAGLSLPELTMLMELAAFFDTSVDVLLGYELQDNRLEATVERLKNFRIQKNREGLGEAEKALKKYPNSFEIAYQTSASARKAAKSNCCTGPWSCWKEPESFCPRIRIRVLTTAPFAEIWRGSSFVRNGLRMR